MQGSTKEKQELLKDIRKGWAEAFQRMSANKDEVLLDGDLIHHSWDEEEWEW